MLDHARAELERTVAALAPFARRGVPIVGLEPSCLLTLRDEALHLLGGDDGDGAATQDSRAATQDEARAVAKHAFLVDEFLARGLADAASVPPQSATADAPRAAHIHGHCHQKAVGTASATGEALTAHAGMPGTLIESSCCGMAGSFGYTAKHLRTSRAMGELGLFPALRAAAPEDTVIANGFSCRAQIRAGTGRRARHLVEVLDRCLNR
jgi:Fe-S oxidoreductase